LKEAEWTTLLYNLLVEYRETRNFAILTVRVTLVGQCNVEGWVWLEKCLVGGWDDVQV
jgi:hypothetical protein